jgi:predicted DNA-binding transcriptional regulator AlpA
MNSSSSVLIDRATFAQMLGRSLRSFDADRAANRLPHPITLGGSLKWRREEVMRWIEAGCPSANKWAEMEAQRKREGGRQ